MKIFIIIKKNVFEFGMVFLILMVLLPVICAQAQTPDMIKSVSPLSARQGETITLTITLDESLSSPPLPPSEIMPESVKIGTLEGTSISRSDFVITAIFSIPVGESAGTKDVSLEFSAPPDQPDMGSLISAENDAFEVLSGEDTDSPAEEPSDSSQETVITDVLYTVTDTGQEKCYNASSNIACPGSGQAFYGQDAQHTGAVPDFTDNGDGTVTDNNTGLMWQKSADTDGDGDIDAADKLTWTEIQAYPVTLNVQNFGGYSDWRVPSIKELYSLTEFSGSDPSGYEDTDTSGLTPFIDTDYFDFAYGDTDAGERVIDAQYASDTLYVGTTSDGSTLFGVNFADGRIKGYGLSIHGSDKTFFLICVRGNTSYGDNNFANNGDGTVTDSATGLMWSQADSGTGMTWEDALAWVEQKNAENYLGYDDWRMPNAKELQSIVDYTRSPDTTASAAIDLIFSVTSITNEAGQTDYPFYWAGTTHTTWNGMGGGAVYVAFGRALGYMNGSWQDVHGAGAQRSDPKTGDPEEYPTGHGPQGDAIRIYNYVRCVRDTGESPGDTCMAGNIDGTGSVTVKDAVMVLQILTSINPDNVQPCADINDDGKIGHEELVYILRKVAGFI
ncbi:Lcl domain-containing protein [Desulfonema magnum]|uniref:Lcl domain-containing protein n=1 Tax=Desulfonema magnum TaxID=45655 RepID=UPI001A9BE968|nr:DUF1566 domain-containing protein [Desulfonema magnum]